MAFFDYDIEPILKVSNAKTPTKEMTALRKDIRDQMEKQNKFWEDRAFDYTCEEDNQVSMATLIFKKIIIYFLIINDILV